MSPSSQPLFSVTYTQRRADTCTLGSRNTPANQVTLYSPSNGQDAAAHKRLEKRAVLGALQGRKGRPRVGLSRRVPNAKAKDGKVGGVDISSPVNITTELHAAGLTLMQTFRKPGKEEGSREDPSTLERMTWLLGHRPISQNTGY